MKIAYLQFRSREARREYLDALRERMYVAGYSPPDVTDWIRARFDSKVLFAHVSGTDDAERAVDVASEVRGVHAKIVED